MPAAGFHLVQWADLPDAPGAFSRWSTAAALSELLHTYFATAERSAAGIVRIRWRDGCPTLAIAGSSLSVVAMGRPSVELSGGQCAISVVVHGGLVVEPGSRPRLTVALDGHGSHVRALVDLADYEPRGGELAAVRWLYLGTQARVHTWVGRRFLAQLRRRWSTGPIG